MDQISIPPPAPIELSDLNEVTIGELCRMRLNWYHAGITFCRELFNEGKPQGLVSKLLDVCLLGVKTYAPMAGDTRPVKPEDWHVFFPDGAEVQNELLSMAKAIFAGASKSRGTEEKGFFSKAITQVDGLGKRAVGIVKLSAAEREGVDRFKDHYIRFLNNGSSELSRPWCTVSVKFKLVTRGSSRKLMSCQTPMNASFDPKGQSRFAAYGTTGLCSNTPRLSELNRHPVENSRVTNFWCTTLMDTTTPGYPIQLFCAFRSGSLSGKRVHEIDEASTKDNVEELLEAVVIAEAERTGALMFDAPSTSLSRQQTSTLRRAQAKSFSPTKQEICLVSINLQTHIRALGILPDEGKNIKAQAETLSEPFSRNVLSANPCAPPGYQQPKMFMRYGIRTLSFNCEVNNIGGMHISDKLNPMDMWLALWEVAEGYLSACLPKTPEAERDYAAKAIRALLDVFHEIERLDPSMLTCPANDYHVASLTGVLAYLSGCHVHFNCKSGKDRTGLMDVECKRLAFCMFKSYVESGEKVVVVPAYHHSSWRSDDRIVFNTILRFSGNFEVQERNTGGRGFKVGQVVNLFGLKKVGALPTDRELAERFGGIEGLAFVQGLMRYMDIDPLGLKLLG